MFLTSGKLEVALAARDEEADLGKWILTVGLPTSICAQIQASRVFLHGRVNVHITRLSLSTVERMLLLRMAKQGLVSGYSQCWGMRPQSI